MLRRMSPSNFRYFTELNRQRRTLDQKWAILDRLAGVGTVGEEIRFRDEERVLGMLVHAGLVEVFRRGHGMLLPRRNYVRLTEKGWQAYHTRQLPAGPRRPERRAGGVFRGQ